MMNDLPNNTSAKPSASEMQARSKKSLREFFQQKSIRNLVDVLVPGILAAVLFPIFGPAAAAGAAAIAVQNGLKLLGIDMSAETIDKVLKPLEGKSVDESDVEEVLQAVLPKDKQVNEEAARTLVVVLPEVRQAAMENPKVDVDWLTKSLETSLQKQGSTMAALAPQMSELVSMDQAALEEKIRYILANWSSNIQQMMATQQSKIAGSEQTIEGKGGANKQTMDASDNSEISQSKQNIKLT